MRGLGLLTIVDHGEGYMSLYAYNQSLLKSVGERVEAGEPIATVGQSGGQSDAGVYFEIRHHSKPVNPSNWIK
jgi:murein hydrolase activator